MCSLRIKDCSSSYIAAGICRQDAGAGKVAHGDHFLEAALDAHGHGGERRGARAAGALQLQVYHRSVNLHQFHIAPICGTRSKIFVRKY